MPPPEWSQRERGPVLLPPSVCTFLPLTLFGQTLGRSWLTLEPEVRPVPWKPSWDAGTVRALTLASPLV